MNSTGKLWEESKLETSINHINPELVSCVRSILNQPEWLGFHSFSEQRLRFIVLWLGMTEIIQPDFQRTFEQLHTLWSNPQFIPYMDRESSIDQLKKAMDGSHCYMVRLGTTYHQTFVVVYTEIECCPVCMEIVDVYKTFKCKHSFCESCVQKMNNNKCPMCREDKASVTDTRGITKVLCLFVNEYNKYYLQKDDDKIFADTVLEAIQKFDAIMKKKDFNVKCLVYANVDQIKKSINVV